MKYKLLLVDIDGTLTPNLGMPPRKFIPSNYLLKTIKRARKHIIVSLCTGRDKTTVMDIVNTLELISPQIIEGGAKIIDSKGNDIWACYISEKSAIKIINILKETKTSFSVVVNSIEILDKLPEDNFNKVSAVLWYDLTANQTVSLKNKLAELKDIAISVNQDRTGNTVYITHKNATKSHAIKKLQEILKIKKEETIGVGDGNNDKPLLLACGLKVAMGNSVDELKGIADYIAQSVDNDGVADIVNKFILS